MQIWQCFFILVTLTGWILTTEEVFLTERELFEIDLLDPSKQEHREKIISTLLNKNKNKIGIKGIQLLAYKFLLEEDYDHVQTLKKKQSEGKGMKKGDEEILVNVFIVDHYLQDTLKGKLEFERGDIGEILDKEKFLNYTHLNVGEFLAKAKKEVLEHPIAIDESEFYDDFDDDL